MTQFPGLKRRVQERRRATPTWAGTGQHRLHGAYTTDMGVEELGTRMGKL